MLDPLGCHEPLPLVRRFYPLGFALDIATNSEEVLTAAEENWGTYSAAFEAQPMRVRIAVSNDESERPASPSYRAMGHLMSIIAGRENFAVCDLRDGYGFCRLTRGVAQERAWMRQRFLDGIVYCMLVCREVTPIHAACVTYKGRGVLLCGRSGAGKSSLAYACASRGWTFVTDDVAYLRRGVPERIVLGKPQFLKFLTSASELFPELRRLPVITDQAGEPALELATTSMISTAFQAPLNAIVFLNRMDGCDPELTSISPEIAFQRLMADMPSFGETVYSLHKESIDILVQTTNLAEFRYSEFESAVVALETLIRG